MSKYYIKRLYDTAHTAHTAVPEYSLPVQSCSHASSPGIEALVSPLPSALNQPVETSTLISHSKRSLKHTFKVYLNDSSGETLDTVPPFNRNTDSILFDVRRA